MGGPQAETEGGAVSSSVSGFFLGTSQSSQGQTTMFYVWSRASFVAFAGFLFGYDHGSINGVKEMQGFRETFGIPYTSDNESSTCSDDVEASATLGLIVSLLSYGALVGALLAGVLASFFGRKVAIIIGATVFTLGAAVQTGAHFLWMVCLGRVIYGLGLGVLLMVVPVYIAELAPKKARGRMVAFNFLNTNFGFVTGIVVSFVCREWLFGWRISLGLQCLSGSIYAIGMVFLPETPRWLVQKGKNEKAAKVLSRVHKNEKKVEDELNEIQATLQESEKQIFWSTLKDLFHWQIIHRVILGVFLQLFNRLGGSAATVYYSVSIFCKIGVPPYVATIVFGVVGIIGTVISVSVIDKFGRKALLLVGALGMMLTLLLAATLLLEFRVEGGENKGVGYFVVVLILLFMFTYVISFGPGSWVINSELHPLNVRGISVSLTTSAFWIGNIIATQTTPIMLSSPLRVHGTFYVLAGINFLAFLFTLLTIPETKRESLESLETLFSKPWLERTKILYYLRCGCPWSWCKRKRVTITLTAVNPLTEMQ